MIEAINKYDANQNRVDELHISEDNSNDIIVKNFSHILDGSPELNPIIRPKSENEKP